tara:strand:+ start:69 stop:944 length:876 start_codon:yes stop_codon:yes gene_type:complete
VKNLNLDNPIDEHLKPVKDSDGTSTSIELSTDKIRVKDLEVVGTTTGISASDDTKLPLAGGTVTGAIHMDDDVKIELGDAGEYISGDGADLYISSSGYVNFNGSRVTNIGRLYLDISDTPVNTIKDEDDMASNNSQALVTQQSVKAYVDNTIRDVKSSGFNYSYTAGTKVYIPLGATTGESSSTVGGNEWRHFVVPFDGYLDQVVIRSEEACGSTVVGFHKSSTGVETPNITAAQTVTVDMATDDTAYKFNFTSNHMFSAGDIIAISFDPTNDANDTNATIILVYDGSQGV